MKNSEKNLAVIENFILWLTHCSDEKDFGFTEIQSRTPEEMYQAAVDYIEEDHVDGKGNPEDYKNREQHARELLDSKGFFTDNLWQVDDVKARFNCTNEMAKKILRNAFNNSATYDQIWMSIDSAAESYGLENVGDDYS